MLDYDEITKIKNLYLQNKNIMKYLRTKRKSKNNSEIIMYSYDLQSGSYFSNRSRKNIQIPYTKLGKDIAKLISKLGAKTVLECGVGEGNSLVQILKNKIENNPKFLGFDISLSRLLYAKKYLCQEKKKNVKLFTADMLNIPLPDNSIDIVFSAHAIEPNHGKEKQIIQELFRITRRYVILIEPTYELASNKTKHHINEHQYVKNLPRTLAKVGFKILSNEYKNYFSNNNEDSLIVAEKNGECKMSKKIELVSPISFQRFTSQSNYLYSKSDGYVFPIINGIPCLVKSNAILASKIQNF